MILSVMFSSLINCFIFIPSFSRLCGQCLVFSVILWSYVSNVIVFLDVNVFNGHFIFFAVCFRISNNFNNNGESKTLQMNLICRRGVVVCQIKILFWRFIKVHFLAFLLYNWFKIKTFQIVWTLQMFQAQKMLWISVKQTFYWIFIRFFDACKKMKFFAFLNIFDNL